MPNVVSSRKQGPSNLMDVDKTTKRFPEKSRVESDEGLQQISVHLCLESKAGSSGKWQRKQHSQDRELKPR